uniref:Uncharacterized protein n=1 Tax=Ixodes ricinus TaxID=34613 RepID=A0A6B0USB7_IXORI
MMNWRQPRPPCGIGALCWLATSRKTATVVLGLREHSFHWQVPPMPVSVSETLELFTLVDIHGPMAPATLSSREALTSSSALNPIRNSPRASLAKTRWNVCLNRDELKESPMTTWPPVMLGQYFISCRPVWSSAHE